jgi:hypothetical protein
VGQLSDPYGQAEDEGLGIIISGLPGELDEPDPEADADDAAVGPGAGTADADAETDGEVVYELDDWSEIERGAVSDRLREAGIPHGWEGTSLHVAAEDDAAVENILDIVEGDHGAAPTLDGDQDQVAYDLSDWDDDRLTALVDELDAAGIAHGWDDDELFVHAVDEQTVDELLDRVAHPHELPAEADDGPAGAELLGEVFVAADRLQHDPDDHEGAVSMLGLGHAVEGAEPPYGLGSKEWDHLRGRVTAVCSQLQASQVDEDAVMDAARDLRNALRSYV